MPKVSVIMPVYNSEKFLKDAIDSVLVQTFKDFELILVDDGSTDLSGSICDELAEEDDRIVVIHKENGGICNARNCGLKAAKGKYISFCDNDDYMMPECLEKTVNAIESERSDVVRFCREHVVIDENETYRETTKAITATYCIDNWNNYITVVKSCANGPWAGLYSKELIFKNKIYFNEVLKYGFEDVLFTSTICSKAAKVTVLSDVLYRWTSRYTSSTSMKTGMNIFENRFEGILLLMELENNIGMKLKRTDLQKQERNFDYVNHLIGEVCLLNISLNDKRTLFRKCKNKILAKTKLMYSSNMNFKDNVRCFYFKHDCLRLYEITRRIAHRFVR